MLSILDLTDKLEYETRDRLCWRKGVVCVCVWGGGQFLTTSSKQVVEVLPCWTGVLYCPSACCSSNWYGIRRIKNHENTELSGFSSLKIKIRSERDKPTSEKGTSQHFEQYGCRLAVLIVKFADFLRKRLLDS